MLKMNLFLNILNYGYNLKEFKGLTHIPLILSKMGSSLEDERLNNLIDGLSNSILGLSFEGCEIGDKLNVDPEMM